MPTQQNNPRRTWILFVIALILIGLIAGGGSYLFYTQNSTLKRELLDVNQMRAAIEDTLEKTVEERNALQTKIDELQCDTEWKNGACTPMSEFVDLSVSTSTGFAPLKVTFTVRVPDLGYTLDFGDETNAELAKSVTGGTCKPEADGRCTVKVAHTYAAKPDNAAYSAKLLKGGTEAKSVSITVTAK